MGRDTFLVVPYFRVPFVPVSAENGPSPIGRATWWTESEHPSLSFSPNSLGGPRLSQSGVDF